MGSATRRVLPEPGSLRWFIPAGESDVRLLERPPRSSRTPCARSLPCRDPTTPMRSRHFRSDQRLARGPSLSPRWGVSGGALKQLHQKPHGNPLSAPPVTLRLNVRHPVESADGFGHKPRVWRIVAGKRHPRRPAWRALTCRSALHLRASHGILWQPGDPRTRSRAPVQEQGRRSSRPSLLPAFLACRVRFHDSRRRRGWPSQGRAPGRSPRPHLCSASSADWRCRDWRRHPRTTNPA